MNNQKVDTEQVLNTIRKVISEVRQEMSSTKVLTEGKEPEKVFEHHMKESKKYVKEKIIEALRAAEK